MTKEEFREFYKKNKVAVIGVPVIIFLLFFNNLVLKPRRAPKNPTTPAASTDASPTSEKATISAPPAPLNSSLSSIPPLDSRAEARLIASEIYPYYESKNIFKRQEKVIESQIVYEEYFAPEPEPEVIERPEISYHGFFKVGPKKVAILKLAQKLLLTHEGQSLFETPFTLKTIFPDYIIISEEGGKKVEFEISLNSNSAPASPKR